MNTHSAKRRLRLGLLLFVSGLLGACSNPTPTLRPLPSDSVILAFGDSLTFGTGAVQHASYPAVLEQLSGRRVVNSGVPGEVTATAVSRLPAVLDRYQPDLLILCHGGNDLLRNNGQQQLLENLESMVNLAQSRGVDVVLVGVPQPKLLFLKPAQVYDRLAEKQKLVYLRDALPGLEGDPAMKSDPIHLNPNGYRRLAEAIHELLIDSGALPSG